VKLFPALLRLVGDLGFWSYDNLIPESVKDRSNSRYVFAKTCNYNLLEDNNLMFFRPFEQLVGTFKVEILTQLCSHYLLSHFVQLDAEVVNFFHCFGLKIINSTELFYFFVNWRERWSLLTTFLDVVEVVDQDISEKNAVWGFVLPCSTLLS
jgi:hypothetical protein